MSKARGLKWVLAKTGLACLMAAAILCLSGALFAKFASWQRFMDPRTRILWHGHFDGSKIVLLGDSAFASLFADTPDKTLWERMRALTGGEVFPGGLPACRVADMKNEARLIEASWPAGTTVFINISPTRLIYSGAPDPEGGSYAAEFSRLVAGDSVNAHPSAPQLAAFLARRSKYWWGKFNFFYRNDHVLEAYVNGLARPPFYFKRGPYYNRVWNLDPEYAVQEFSRFQSHVMPGKGIRSLTWTLELRNELAAHGMRPVFVITPLNRDLLKAFASPGSALQLTAYMESAHDAFTAYAAAHHIESLDLFHALSSDGFADMIHPNEKGDDQLARALVSWLGENVPQRAAAALK